MRICWLVPRVCVGPLLVTLSAYAVHSFADRLNTFVRDGIYHHMGQRKRTSLSRHPFYHSLGVEGTLAVLAFNRWLLVRACGEE